MKVLVVYDSAYGNTEKIAESVGSALASGGEDITKRADEVGDHDFHNLELLVIGSPTQGGRPTKPIERFIKELPPDTLKTTKVAVFDTRFAAEEQKKGLRLLMKVIGYAAPKMASIVRHEGGTVVSEPQGFIVGGTQGPLREGEAAKAADWARSLRTRAADAAA